MGYKCYHLEGQVIVNRHDETHDSNDRTVMQMCTLCPFVIPTPTRSVHAEVRTWVASCCTHKRNQNFYTESYMKV